jgi:hypothetical protein
MRDIKYKSVACGPAGSFQPGDVRPDVPEKEAEGLVQGGYAEYAVRKVEHAVARPTEVPAVAEVPAVKPVAAPGRRK